MNRSSIRGMAALLALVLLPIIGFAAPAPGPAARPGGKAQSPPQPKPNSTTMRLPMRTPTMPDSVLAKVYGAKDVTWSRFMKACRKLGVAPDRLTPMERRQVLDLLIEQSILTTRAQRDPRDWTARDSAEYRALRDKLLLSTALNAALFEQATPYMERGDTVPDMQKLGVMARDSLMAKLQPQYDDVALRHLAGAFAALPVPNIEMKAMQKLEAMGKLPVVSPEDSTRVLLTCPADTMTVLELLHEYSRLNPTYRPRVETEDAVRDLASNFLFNNLLRREAEKAGLDRVPNNAGQLADKAEYLDVQRYVAKNVYAKIAMDTATLKRHYAKHPDWFRSNASAGIVRMVFDTRPEAERWRDELALPGRAESLATQSARAGVPYAATLNEDADSALFKRVRKGGVGVTLGPDSTTQGWRVMKVMSIELDHRLPFEEAYERVKQDWYERDGERLMREVLAELRTHTIVMVNERSSYLRPKTRKAR